MPGTFLDSQYSVTYGTYGSLSVIIIKLAWRLYKNSTIEIADHTGAYRRRYYSLP